VGTNENEWENEEVTQDVTDTQFGEMTFCTHPLNAFMDFLEKMPCILYI